MKSLYIKIIKWVLLFATILGILYISTLEPYFLIKDIKDKFLENSKSQENEIYDTTDAILPEMQGYPEKDRKILESLLDKLE